MLSLIEARPNIIRAISAGEIFPAAAARNSLPCAVMTRPIVSSFNVAKPANRGVGLALFSFALKALSPFFLRSEAAGRQKPRHR